MNFTFSGYSSVNLEHLLAQREAFKIAVDGVVDVLIEKDISWVKDKLQGQEGYDVSITSMNFFVPFLMRSIDEFLDPILTEVQFDSEESRIASENREALKAGFLEFIIDGSVSDTESLIFD